MMMCNKILGVIPARGGSKRVERKNIREVGGRPLVAHAIEQADESELLDRTIVSTEDDEIAEVAKSYGGEVPFKRPEELATDTAKGTDVVLHALDWFRKKGEEFDLVATIQATSPFRTPEDIDDAIGKLVDSEADSVVSVSEFSTPPVWAVTEDAEGYLSAYFEEGYLWVDETTRSQDTPNLCHPNGAVFAAYVSEFYRQEGFYTDHTIGYTMPRSRSLDIDEPFDLELAKAMMEKLDSI